MNKMLKSEGIQDRAKIDNLLKIDKQLDFLSYNISLHKKMI